MDIPDQAQATNQPKEAMSDPPAVYLLPGGVEGGLQEAECLPGQRTAEIQDLFEGFEASSDFEYPNPRAILEEAERSSAEDDADRVLRDERTKKDEDRSELERPKRLSFGRALILGGFPSATFAVGAVMMIGALAGDGAVTDPNLALYLLIAGLGLGLTAWTALRRG